MVVGALAAYHPYLFCELYRLGHAEPDVYLAAYGFTRDPEGT